MLDDALHITVFFILVGTLYWAFYKQRAAQHASRDAKVLRKTDVEGRDVDFEEKCGQRARHQKMEG
jgi:hypothetical protein